MKNKSLLFLLSIVIIFLSPLSAWSEEKITWLRLDFPPIHIHDGPYANKGVADYTIQLLINNLKGYSHELLKCNVARAQLMLKSGEKVGHPSIIKRPDRKAYVYFSLPAYVAIPNCVIISKHKYNLFKPYLNEQGDFSLEKAIIQSELIVGVSAERAYGGIIDEILMKHKGHKNIMAHYSMILFKGILEKMLIDRIDYVIGYPNEAQFFTKETGQSKDIVCLPIEGMPKYVIGYIGFPKNDWGKTIIEKVDMILKQHRNSPEYRAAYESWLDELSIERYRVYAKKVFGDS
ncbi:MAG: TIGR02285 family protein [Desulfobacteraceae bacterium]|nr:TIGR02285 family protein [Desulfobacteraceae bacterium]